MEECLKRKLVFGDVEQIEALKRERKRIQEIEEAIGMEFEGPLKEFYVTVTYTNEDTFTVHAPDILSAGTIARAEMEEPGFNQEYELDLYEIKRVKK